MGTNNNYNISFLKSLFTTGYAQIQYDHVSSRDLKKKQAGSFFDMRAGLRNNEFCLCGLTYQVEKKKL